LQLFSFGGYGLALAALALVVFGAYDSYPNMGYFFPKICLGFGIMYLQKSCLLLSCGNGSSSNEICFDPNDMP